MAEPSAEVAGMPVSDVGDGAPPAEPAEHPRYSAVVLAGQQTTVNHKLGSGGVGGLVGGQEQHQLSHLFRLPDAGDGQTLVGGGSLLLAEGGILHHVCVDATR